jgi:hypothetical protein
MASSIFLMAIRFTSPIDSAAFNLSSFEPNVQEFKKCLGAPFGVLSPSLFLAAAGL